MLTVRGIGLSIGDFGHGLVEVGLHAIAFSLGFLLTLDALGQFVLDLLQHFLFFLVANAVNFANHMPRDNGVDPFHQLFFSNNFEFFTLTFGAHQFCCGGTFTQLSKGLR